MDFSQIQLIYRAEGNANLVLVLPQHKKVLRLPKATTDSLKNEEYIEPKDHMAYMGLMTHLLGKEYAYIPEIVSISSTERDRLNRYSISYRPAERLDKEFCGQFGLLLPDATQIPDDLMLKEVTLGDTYSIEIKPKQGWMLQQQQQQGGESELPNLFELRGIKKCRYCCMQYLKLKNHKIGRLSSYCPMDIFSGDVIRMKKALNALFQEPQNNLRIFKNGIFLYGCPNSGNLNILENHFPKWNRNILDNLLIKCLLKNYCESSYVYPNISSGANVYGKLPHGCILEKILDLQLLAKKNLNILAKDLYKPVKTYSYLKNLLNKNVSNINDDLTSKEQYMIGATTMDCSIMITFNEIENCNNLRYSSNLVSVDDKMFLTKVTAIDLDPKADNHFIKYLTQTNEAYAITEEYLKS